MVNPGLNFLDLPSTFVQSPDAGAVVIFGTLGNGSTLQTNTPIILGTENLNNLGDGSLSLAVRDVLSQGPTGPVVLAAALEGADEIETLDNLNQVVLTNLSHIEAATGLVPSLVIAPGWTHQTPGDAQNPVVAAFDAEAPKVFAHALVDAPQDGVVSDAITYAGYTNNHHIITLFPSVITSLGGVAETRPASSFVAGLLSRLETTGDIGKSPHYEVLRAVSGASKPLNHGEAAADANVLHQNRVNSIVRHPSGSGFMVFGDQTNYSQDLPDMESISNSRVAAYIKRGLRTYLLEQWSGQQMTRAFWRGISTDGQNWLSSLVQRGVILAGSLEQSPNHTDEDTRGRLARLRLKIAFAATALEFLVETKYVNANEIDLDFVVQF